MLTAATTVAPQDRQDARFFVGRNFVSVNISLLAGDYERLSLPDVLDSFPDALVTFSVEPGFVIIRQAGKSGPELRVAVLEFLQHIEYSLVKSII